MTPKKSHLLFLLAAASCGSTASAADGTWLPTTPDRLWSEVGNWSGGTIADGSGSLATFSMDVPVTDLTVKMDASHTLGGLTFGDTDATTAGNWLLTNNGTATNTLTLTGNKTITVNTLGLASGTEKNATISAIIEGTEGLTKAGAGVLVLSGDNLYTGATTVSGGKLVVNGEIGTSSTTVEAGATLGGLGEVGKITLKSGAILAPGNDPGATLTPGDNIGLLTVDEDLNVVKGSILSWELASQNEYGLGVTNFDTVQLAGEISGTDGIIRMIVGDLDLSTSFWSTDKSWQIFEGLFGAFDENSPIGAGFSSFELVDASTLSTIDYKSAGRFSFNGTTGSLDWSAAEAPEPGGTLAALLMVAGLMRRRRTVRG